MCTTGHSHVRYNMHVHKLAPILIYSNLRNDHKMEDIHVPDGVKDEVTLLESNRNKVFWQRIVIHNQWLEKKWCYHHRKLYCENILVYKRMLDTVTKNIVTLRPLVVPSIINTLDTVWENKVYICIIAFHEEMICLQVVPFP